MLEKTPLQAEIFNQEVQIKPWQDPEIHPYDPVDVASIARELSDEERNKIRTLLIQNSGLLFKDIAEELGIHLYTLERAAEKPEEVVLKEDTEKTLSLSSLGKIVLQRRDQRIQERRDEQEIRQNTLRLRSEQTQRIKDSLKAKRQSRTRHLNINDRQKSAKRLSISRSRNVLKKHEDRQKIRKQLSDNLQGQLEQRQELLPTILSDRQIKVLSVLHLDYSIAAKELGWSQSYIFRIAKEMKELLGLKTKEQLVMWGLASGIAYELPELKNEDQLSLEQREISQMLIYDNYEIAEKCQLTYTQVSNRINNMLRTLGLNNRMQLMLAAQIHFLGPMAEDYPTKKYQKNNEKLLEGFNDNQKKLIDLIFLLQTDIAKVFNQDRAAISSRISTILSKSGHKNTYGFAIDLYNQGYKFEVTKIKGRLEDILTERELEAIQFIDLDTEGIAEQLGITVNRTNSILLSARQKVQARSPTEFTIMLKEYGPIEVAKTPELSRQESFFRAVGIKPVDIEDARKLLVFLTPFQAYCIDAYYFSDNQPSWSEVGVPRKTSHESALRAARKGIDTIREEISKEIQLRTNPDFISNRKAELLSKIGLDKTSGAKLDQLLEGLTEKERSSIEHYYLGRLELSWGKISESTGIPLSSLTRNAARALAKLKKQKEELNSSKG